MSILLADIDATCSSLGLNNGAQYTVEPDALQGLKHLIWILKRDSEDHEYRRYIGQKKVIQTDLIPMLINNYDDTEFSDVLLRLVVNLTNPALLLYRGELPKDGPGRRNFLHLIEILQGYKKAFAQQSVWAALGSRLQSTMEIDWAERTEEQGLIIERILVLTRNVLQVPASPEAEKRADNDASLHDQVLWALHQAGVLDLILYILGSEHENQYHLHALEIVCLIYREQTPVSLADASLQRSVAEKQRDELELLTARKREKARIAIRAPAARHSRFGGTYVVQNIKSISDNDLICHQSLQKAMQIDLDKDKTKLKKSFRHVKETGNSERRSAFSIRLFLREFCIEILRSSYNNLVRQVRRVLERNKGQDSISNDDSYLLWAIKFFMEFNRASGFQLHLVSESLSVHCFHWIITRIEHDLDMLVSDKTRSRVWARRLHVGVQAYREMLESLQMLQKIQDEKAKDLFSLLQNNVFYVLEYREVILHLLINFNESHSTRAYLRDVIETTHLFFKMLEKYCQGTIRVQSTKRNKQRRNKGKAKSSSSTSKEIDQEDLEDVWMRLASQVSTCLANEISLPEEDQPIPFDAASDKSIDDQKDDCMIRIHSLLRDEKYEHAIILMRAGREVWPENDCFGSATIAPEDELMLLKDIFLANLPRVSEKDVGRDNELIERGNDDEENDYGDSEEEDDARMTETDFNFDDFAKRLLNPKVVRACILVLNDWEKITTKSLKAAVTILHRIAFGCKMPAMLYQASLFRIFQRVFHAPKEAHHEELRRLGIYIMRQFVVAAPNNPKIYAELLFFKSIKEANAIDMGYEDIYGNDGAGSGVAAKRAWSEEQEDELRRLFMENQSSPATDQDVIDWLAENLVDQTRTRRSIIKKLKELGLIFKAPTKKSNVNSNVSKTLWTPEQDEELKALYENNRLDENVLHIIVQVFANKFSRQAIIKRMIQIGLIADKSEVMPIKKGKNKSNQKSSDDDSDDVDRPARMPKKSSKQVHRKLPKTSLNIRKIKGILSEVEESWKEAVVWLVDSLNEAVEDYEEPSDDPDDGIPLVPIMAAQREALENSQFKELLQSIGMSAPMENETYWRIPVNLNPEELTLRSKILNEEEVEDPEEQAKHVTTINDDDDEVDVDDNIFSKWRNKMNDLVYSKSDNEDETREPLKMTKEKMKKKKKQPQETRVKNKKKPVNESGNEENVLEFDSEDIRSKLAALSDSEEESTVQRVRNILDSDSDTELASRLVVSDDEADAPKKQHHRGRLVISDDEDDEVVAVEKPERSIRIIDSDDEEPTSTLIHLDAENDASPTENNKKRDRSDSSGSEGEKAHKKSKSSRKVISSDEED